MTNSETNTPSSAPESVSQSPIQPMPAESFPDRARKPIDPRRRKRLIRVLIILLVVAIPLSAALIYNANWNFYDTTLRHLSFDYREGELNGDPFEQTVSQYALPLSLEIKDETVQLEAAVYHFNSEGALATNVSKYQYAHSKQYSLLTLRTGVQNWFQTATKELRQVDARCDVWEEGQWMEDPLSRVPDLYSFFFRVEDAPGVTITYHDCFPSTVDRKSYLCEIWLMEDSHTDTTFYYTLYRYYSGTRLAAVRVVPSHTDQMDVYDIIAYDCNPHLAPLEQ